MKRLLTQKEIAEKINSEEDFVYFIFNKACEYIWQAQDGKWESRFKELCPGYQTVLATTVVEGDIMNGGFYQYFGNSTAQDFHFYGVEGFKNIGAIKIAELLEYAFETILKQSPSFRTSYLVDGIQNSFNEANSREEINLEFPIDVDAEFYRLDEGNENIDTLRRLYVKTHINDF